MASSEANTAMAVSAGRSVSTLRRAGDILSRAALVLLFAAFAYANFAKWRSTGQPYGLGVTLLEGWTALMFAVRRTPKAVSNRMLAWVAAPIGSFAMLLARPESGGLPHMVGEAVQLLGVLMALVSLGVLGRSFGLVAANRGLKATGPYRLVRHPAYASYLVAYLGYVAESPSLRNVALLVVSTVFQLVRISEEERVLVADAGYESYRRRVRFRLIPLVY
jgi:protein-S-isoprenylcysteine O-methyltransferase Ste14